MARRKLLPQGAIAVGVRVYLRPPEPFDVDAWVKLRRASRTFLRATEPTPTVGFDPYGPEAFNKMLLGANTERSRRLLVCISDGGAIAGQISMSDISRGPFQSCYIGYWIGRPFAGQGLMTEALPLALRYAFIDLGLHRVEANIVPGNAPSLALVARCGFRYEGLAQRLLHLGGRWRDHERWAITVEDWREQRRRSAHARPARPKKHRAPGTSASAGSEVDFLS